MRKRFVVAMLAISAVLSGLYTQSASATSPNVVISQVQVGPTGSLSNEFIELYNNADTEVDITNWCLYYASAGQPQTQMGSKVACFTTENPSLHLFLPPYSFSFAISTALATASPSLGSDMKFSATLASAGGHLRLADTTANVIDKLGWGTAVAPETLASIAPTSPKVLQRKQSAVVNILQDTDNNNIDIELANSRTSYMYGAVYEKQDVCSNIAGVQENPPTGNSVDDQGNCVAPPIDVCSNIDGLQVIVPNGFALDESNACQPDVCANIAGLQTTLPSGKELDDSANCVEQDYCDNIAGLQTSVPAMYRTTAPDICLLDVPPIFVSELFANAVGSDEGNEFIEIYNPNSSMVDLSLYVLKVGTDAPKTYSFPSGTTIDPGGFITFYGDDIPFTLTNTTGQVSISTTDGQMVDQSASYVNADEAVAWALINGMWQYTNQPTPNAHNVPSITVVDDTDEIVTGLKPCATNQYRHPETNRCRLLATVGSTLIACKDGQYRSEITNRCRSIAADVDGLTPCKENQERNPDTNRCRLIASSDTTLTPCKEGQERNTETNRCRNVTTAIPGAAFAVQPVVDTGGGIVSWWAIGGVSLVALGYAVWEWREEILHSIRKVATFFHSHK